VTLTLCACAECIGSSDLLEFNQTHNAATFSSKCETFALQVHQRRAWTGSGLDVLQDTCDFSDQDWIWILIFEKHEDIFLISITKFPKE